MAKTYTANHRHNLINYWRQYFPEWVIPAGYHVHHIKPKCTFKDQTDPRIHHPTNLIALHPDDHVSIHKCRGDKVTEKFIRVAGSKLKGKPKTKEHNKKVSIALKGRKLSPEHIKNMKKALKGRATWNKGIPASDEAKKKMSQSHRGITAHNKGEKGRKHFNNGTIGIMEFPGSEPDGFCLGRLQMNYLRGSK